MQLIKINAVQPQAAEAAFTGGSQVFRLSVFYPFVGTGPVEAALRGNDQICRIRVQRLGYDLFTHSGPIGIRGIDEIDPQFDSAPQNPDRLSPICRLAPNSIPRDSHRAVSQARNAKIVSDQEFPRPFGGRLVSLPGELVVLHIISPSAIASKLTDALAVGVMRGRRRCKKRYV